MRVHEAPSASAWSGMIGVVMPSRRAQASTSLPPTSLNSCTEGTFFDQISAYSSVTWYSTVLLRLVGVQTSPVIGIDLGARHVVQQRREAVAAVERQRVVDRLVGRAGLAAGLRRRG